jgi:hypothetical protein
MNTDTGEIYEGEKKDEKHISLGPKMAQTLLTLPEEDRVEYFVKQKFNAYVNSLGFEPTNEVRMALRKAYIAGFALKNDNF